MKQSVTVIGAGMVGVSVAWHLQQKGFVVTLLDKKAPGEETSYGNAGLIQREAIYPHPCPRQWQEVKRILPNQALDVRYRPKAMLHYAKALWQYWHYSEPHRFEKIVKEWATLIEQCTETHGQMIDSSGAKSLIRQVGWLQLHRTKASFDAACLQAKTLTEHGVEYAILTPNDIAQLEPDLNVSPFVGGIHWQNAWQVSNPGALVKAYAADFVRQGGVLVEATVRDIQKQDAMWCVNTAMANFNSEHVVVAGGPWSTELLSGLGYRFPLFPMRGYHRHYRLAQGAVLNHSIVDEESGFVLGPKDLGIRLTTGAELTLPDAPMALGQLHDDEQVARNLLPLTDAVEETPWFGHRPCLPDMKPIIGAAHKAGHEGLWLAFGHAHQGFTLGPATGKLLAQMMSGETPSVSPAPFASNRFDSLNRS